MQVIFLGLPGAGKGTQASAIHEDFGIPHIATGDMFRAAQASGSELGLHVKSYLEQGLLVPDELTIAVVRARLQEADAQKGFLLDGFPRTLPQATALDDMLQGINRPLTHVLYLDVCQEELLQRLTGRRVCAACGASYHLAFNRPQQDGLCDKCGGSLTQRADDTPDAVLVRLQVNLERTLALAEFYSKRGILHKIAGEQPISAVYDALREALQGGHL